MASIILRKLKQGSRDRKAIAKARRSASSERRKAAASAYLTAERRKARARYRKKKGIGESVGSRARAGSFRPQNMF